MSWKKEMGMISRRPSGYGGLVRDTGDGIGDASALRNEQWRVRCGYEEQIKGEVVNRRRSKEINNQIPPPQ